MRHLARALRAGLFATALVVALIVAAAAGPESTAGQPSSASSSAERGGGRALVAVRLRAGTVRPSPGQEVVYRIAMRNRGGAAARDVRVFVRLSPILQHLRGGRRRPGSRTVVFSARRLASGARRVFRMRAKVRAAGQIVIRSRVRYRRERARER